MPTGYEGFAALGELAGGSIGTPGVYEDTLKKAYSVDDQLQKAGRSRAQRLLAEDQLTSRRGGFEESLIAAGLDPAQAAVAANIGRMNQTFSASQAGDYLRPGYLEVSSGARDAILGTSPAALGTVPGEAEMYAQSLGLPPPDPVAAAPDVPTYNRLNAFLQGKSFEPTIELGGAYINSGADVIAGDPFVPTAGTLGDLERDAAAAEAALIRASRAPAAKAAKPPSTAASEAAELRQAREAVQAGADPTAVADMLRARGFANLASKIHKGK